jgi:hypothetical protein
MNVSMQRLAMAPAGARRNATFSVRRGDLDAAPVVWR